MNRPRRILKKRVENIKTKSPLETMDDLYKGLDSIKFSETASSETSFLETASSETAFTARAFMQPTEEKKRITKKKAEENVTVEYEKKTNKKARIPDFSAEGPVLHPNKNLEMKDMVKIMKLWFLKNHKYVVLRRCSNGDIHPAFFIVIDDVWQPNILVQFVRHNTELGDDGSYHVQPLWDDFWSIGYIDEDTMMNCLPFDEERDYHYDESKI
jgi:hypothetical protein